MFLMPYIYWLITMYYEINKKASFIESIHYRYTR